MSRDPHQDDAYQEFMKRIPVVDPLKWSPKALDAAIHSTYDGANIAARVMSSPPQSIEHRLLQQQLRRASGNWSH